MTERYAMDLVTYLSQLPVTDGPSKKKKIVVVQMFVDIISNTSSVREHLRDFSKQSLTRVPHEKYRKAKYKIPILSAFKIILKQYRYEKLWGMPRSIKTSVSSSQCSKHRVNSHYKSTIVILWYLYYDNYLMQS